MISGPLFLLRRRERIVDDSPVPGQQFAYTYDGIGNRTTADVNGRTSVLTSNTLNQYTQRTVPGAIDVRGRALASAGVVVNEGIATRMDDAFHRTVPVDNSSGPQHPEIRVQALGAGAGPGGADLEAEEIGRVYVPGTPEVYSYDFDGNITGDGRWLYTWDFENRLVGMETVAGAPVTAKRKLEFLYDSESRRIRKRVYDWNGTAYVLSSDRRYLYDGWNLMAELVASPTPFARTYVWGLDLSGSEQGAGGVGGLLVIREAGESHYPVYDGNGNVMALVRGSDEGISGRYHYGAFGEVLEVEETGISNPFRFSTKFEDGETGLLYYGFRYYSPETGRWLNRDPIGELGGVNLYGFVLNNPIKFFDILGLEVEGNYPCKCDRKKVNLEIDKMSKDAAVKSKEDWSIIPEYIRNQGSSTGREYGGRVCCNPESGDVNSTGPIPGPWRKTNAFWVGETVDPKSAPNCPDGYEDAGYYNSHPYDGCGKFSPGDVQWMNGLGGGLPLGVGTTDGDSSLLTSCRRNIKTPFGELPDFPHGDAWRVGTGGELSPRPDAFPSNYP